MPRFAILAMTHEEMSAFVNHRAVILPKAVRPLLGLDSYFGVCSSGVLHQDNIASVQGSGQESWCGLGEGIGCVDSSWQAHVQACISLNTRVAPSFDMARYLNAGGRIRVF